MNVPIASIIGEDSNLISKVELYISCRSLINMDTFSKSDPFTVVYMRDNSSSAWVEILRTETIDDNLNPDFTKQVLLDYHFEKIQELKFDVYDSDSNSRDLSSHDFIGSVSTNLARIMGSSGASFSSPLHLPNNPQVRGKIIIRGEEVHANQDILSFKLSARNLDRKDWFGWGRSDPFVSFFRSREDGTFVKVWESEHIMKDLNPMWKSATVSVQVLCNGDIDRPLKIQVSDWNSNGSHDLIGEVISSVRALQPNKEFSLTHPEIKKKKGHKYVDSGILKVDYLKTEKRFSLLDFVRGGMEMNLMIAVVSQLYFKSNGS